MARQVNRLTARTVATAKPGYYNDGAGLGLQVGPTGSKAWLFRYMLRGKAREMGLGSVLTVSLVEARDMAVACRKNMREGHDPIEARKAERAAHAAPRRASQTFRQCAEAYIEAHRSGWKSAKHADQWAATLNDYAYPHFGDMPVANVGKEDVLAALRPIWTTKTETASRVRSRIELVLNYAVQAEHRPETPNPARWRGGLDALLPKPAKVAQVVPRKALDYSAINAFMVRLRNVEGMGAKALEFAILTATRSGEVRGARWSEIDLDGKVWTIPADRTKTTKEHRQPLSTQAVRLLKALPVMAGNPLVFPAAMGGELSDMTLSAVCRRMKVAAVPHGFRSTFRDWSAEATNFPNEVCEMALGHAVDSKTEAAYRRGDLLQKRFALMQEWANYIDRPAVEATVTPIRRKKA